MKINNRDESKGNLSSRRDFFKTTGQVVAATAIAGGTMPYLHAGVDKGLPLADDVRSDAAMIGPKDNIKVTKIETFVLKNSWVFVKISTDAGITGWGEMLKDDAKACAAGALRSVTISLDRSFKGGSPLAGYTQGSILSGWTHQDSYPERY